MPQEDIKKNDAEKSARDVEQIRAYLNRLKKPHTPPEGLSRDGLEAYRKGDSNKRQDFFSPADRLKAIQSKYEMRPDDDGYRDMLVNEYHEKYKARLLAAPATPAIYVESDEPSKPEKPISKKDNTPK